MVSKWNTGFDFHPDLTGGFRRIAKTADLPVKGLPVIEYPDMQKPEIKNRELLKFSM